jgi:two-component system response regulator GlrR
MCPSRDDVETLLQKEAESTSRQRPRVRWTDDSGTHVQALERTMIIGSASSADLVVSDRMVSRLHAELDPCEDGVWVRDLGSRNGTFVGPIRVRHARLSPDASVRVGSTQLSLDEPLEQTVKLWPSDRFGELLGKTSRMRELFMTLSTIATLDSTVLLVGETGTGKELAARAIHGASNRSARPFVVVDCAALPEQLFESELFGHVKGAFTGATATSDGAIAAADGGTLFLDEIGELPISMQPKLLRAIESRTVRRVGETAYRKVDVRFLSATHRDLPTMVNDGSFREDLYFRIAVLPVTMPALREHLDDVPLLLGNFFPDMSASEREGLAVQVQDKRWSGNMRELRNFAERVRAMGTERALEMSRQASPQPPTAPAASATAPLSFDAPFRQFSDAAEREYVRQLMERHRGDAAAAAAAAGIDRTYVYRLIRKHGL